MRRHRLNHFLPSGGLNKRGQRLWVKNHPEVDPDSVNYSHFEENFVSEDGNNMNSDVHTLNGRNNIDSKTDALNDRNNVDNNADALTGRNNLDTSIDTLSNIKCTTDVPGNGLDFSRLEDGSQNKTLSEVVEKQTETNKKSKLQTDIVRKSRESQTMIETSKNKSLLKNSSGNKIVKKKIMPR